MNSSLEVDTSCRRSTTQFLTGTASPARCAALEQSYGRDPANDDSRRALHAEPERRPRRGHWWRGRTAMLDTFHQAPLVLFGILTVVALLVLGWYYMRIPTLWASAVSAEGRAARLWRFVSDGEVTTRYHHRQVDRCRAHREGRRGDDEAFASQFKTPLDASANVHSVSAVGEHTRPGVTGKAHGFFSPGQTMSKAPCQGHRPALDTATGVDGAAEGQDRPVYSTRPRNRSAGLAGVAATGRLHQRSSRLQNQHQPGRRHQSEFGADLGQPGTSRSAIERWAHNLNILGGEAPQYRLASEKRSVPSAPTADQITRCSADCRESLPQTWRTPRSRVRHAQALPPRRRAVAGVPAAARVDRGRRSRRRTRRTGWPALDLSLAINYPPPCLTGFLPAP